MGTMFPIEITLQNSEKVTEVPLEIFGFLCYFISKNVVISTGDGNASMTLWLYHIHLL